MKCNYYSYWMTNCLMIFGDKALICCCSCCCCSWLICMHCLFQRQIGQSLSSVCQKCKVKVANKRGNLDTIPALLLRERRKSIFISIARWMWNAIGIRLKGELKKRTAPWKGMRNGEINESHQLELELKFYYGSFLFVYKHWNNIFL